MYIVLLQDGIFCRHLPGPLDLWYLSNTVVRHSRRLEQVEDRISRLKDKIDFK
jgi:hypothetical protein